jgi:hypothetical protein
MISTASRARVSLPIESLSRKQSKTVFVLDWFQFDYYYYFFFIIFFIFVRFVAAQTFEIIIGYRWWKSVRYVNVVTGEMNDDPIHIHVEQREKTHGRASDEGWGYSLHNIIIVGSGLHW